MIKQPLLLLAMVGCTCLFAEAPVAKAKSSTTTTLTSSANPSQYGQAVVFTATVSSSGGTPTGTVTFQDGATTLSTGTLNGSGKTTCTNSGFSIGTHSISAVYNGSASFNGSTSSTLSQSVTKADQTITLAHLGTITYGNPPITLSATASSGLPVTFSLLSGPATLVGSILTVTEPGTVKVNASQAGNSNYNAAPTVTKPFTVNGPASLTVSGLAVNNKVYDGNSTATLNITGATLVGVVAGDNVTINISGATASFANKNVGTAKTVTISGVTLGGPDAGKYTFTPPTSGTANITARPLTVSATATDKVYDKTTTASVALSDDRVVGDSLSVSDTGAAFADAAVGTGKTVTVSGISVTGTAAGNYTFNTSAVTTASITAVSVTGGITAADKFYDGSATATLIGTNLTGVLSGDDVTLNCANASFSDDTVASNKTVTAGLSLSGADAGNYVLTSATATNTASILAAQGAPTISICMNPDGCAQLHCAGPDGLTFCVQATDCLSPANWTTICTNVIGGDGTCTWIDTSATNCPVRFYRTMVSY